MPPLEFRLGTAEEKAAAEREIAGLDLVPLMRLNFYGHMVKNPDLVGTLTPAVVGFSLDVHRDITPDVAEGILPLVLRQLLDFLTAAPSTVVVEKS